MDDIPKMLKRLRQQDEIIRKIKREKKENASVRFDGNRSSSIASDTGTEFVDLGDGEGYSVSRARPRARQDQEVIEIDSD